MTIANVDAGLYTKLTGASALTTLVGRDTSNNWKIYNSQAPANTVLPYVVFNLASGLLDNTTPHQDLNHVYRVAALATNPNGLLSAYTIQVAVHDALHHQSLSISGWTTFMVVNERINTFVDNVDGTQIFRVIGDYRIRASIT